MNAHPNTIATLLAGMRPSRLAAETFEAFRIIGNGRNVNQYTKALRFETPRAIDLPAVQSLDDAAQEAAPHCAHKDIFFIRRHAGTETTLHFYTVKRRSQPTYVPDGFGMKRVHRLYAEHLFDMNAEATNA